MAAAAIRIVHSFPSAAFHSEKKAEAKAKLSLVPAKRLSFSHSRESKKAKPGVCCSSKFDQNAEEDGTNSPNDAFPSPLISLDNDIKVWRFVTPDCYKLYKCRLLQNGRQAGLGVKPRQATLPFRKYLVGSVGGGAAIKYGSVLFPDLTRPNILQALLMISLPVMVAVLILVKESRINSQSKDLF